MRIEEALLRTQAIDSGKQIIVGTNRYRLEKEDPIDILMWTTLRRKSQIERLKNCVLNAGRQPQAALEASTECVKTGKGGL